MQQVTGRAGQSRQGGQKGLSGRFGQILQLTGGISEPNRVATLISSEL